MPLHLPGSLILGPRAASAAAPATLIAYLTSIGKDSFYARFLAGEAMTVNSDGSGGAVADGGAVGRWSAFQSSNYTARFAQATAAARPGYGASRDGKPGIFGNVSSWFMALDSTTANNQSFTLLASGWMVMQNASWVSQQSQGIAIKTASGNGADTAFMNGAINNTTPQVWRKSLSGDNNSLRMGVTITSSGHHNAAMNLWRRSTATEHSSSTLHELWFVPVLTVSEIAAALNYLA